MLFGNAVDKALGEVRSLQKKRTEFHERAAGIRRQLAGLRGRSADAVLDEMLSIEPEATSKSRQQIFELTGRLEDLDLAQTALVVRIGAALLVEASARAGVVRDEAAKLKKEFETHVSQTQKLLAELKSHEGVDYQIPLPIAGMKGAVAQQGFRMPKSNLLLQEIANLEQRAAGIETAARNKMRGGRAEGPDLASLIGEACSPLEIGPPRSEVEAWFEQASSQPAGHAQPWIESREEDCLKSYVLIWGPGGKITEESHAALTELRPARKTAA